MSMDHPASDREVTQHHAIPRQDLIEVRGFNEKCDTSFIYATFLRSLYYQNDWFGLIDKDIYMHAYHQVVEKLLSQNVKVACLKEDHEIILGYAILKNPTTLHYLFVKSAWRKIGIAKMLLEDEAVDTVTHVTKDAIRILTQKQSNWIFNPFAI